MTNKVTIRKVAETSGYSLQMEPEPISCCESDTLCFLPDAILKEVCITVPAEKLIEAFANSTYAMKEVSFAFTSLASAIDKAEKETAYIKWLPKSRTKHLALYAKKHRVRKKNVAKLLRNLHKKDISEIDEIHEYKEAAIASALQAGGKIYDSNIT